jgi:hypothetical protein
MRQNTSIPTWLPARPLNLLKTKLKTKCAGRGRGGTISLVQERNGKSIAQLQNPLLSSKTAKRLVTKLQSLIINISDFYHHPAMVLVLPLPGQAYQDLIFFFFFPVVVRTKKKTWLGNVCNR